MSSPEPVELPPFSGDDPTCVKCGFTGADTRWAPAQQVSQYGPGDPNAVHYPERLQRICRRCHYAWPEATIDSRPA